MPYALQCFKLNLSILPLIHTPGMKLNTLLGRNGGLRTCVECNVFALLSSRNGMDEDRIACEFVWGSGGGMKISYTNLRFIQEFFINGKNSHKLTKGGR